VRHTDDEADFIETLLAWGRAWRPISHSVNVTPGPTDRAKVAAWLSAVGPTTSGQVTIWDTGECDVEVYELDSLHPRWVESFHFTTAHELLVVGDIPAR